MPKFRALMPVLRVSDVARAIEFYTGILGFEVLWNTTDDGGGAVCLLRSGTIELMLATGSHLGGTPTFTGTFYFQTSGVAEFYEQIKDRVEIVWPLEVMDYGTREFGIHDPDGYTLAFSEDVKTPLPAAPQ
jgi:catechol 2,3-dioxygenase-like lactoylglutathione lyase family enzyme